MSAPPPSSESSAEIFEPVVVRCEQIEVGASSSLVRVTVDLRGSDPYELAGARLLACEGGGHRLHDALPASVAVPAGQLTLGFALRRGETAIAIALGDRSLALGDAATARRDALDRLQFETLRCVSRQLHTTHARLAESRLAGALMETERDQARRTTVRAEAAAYDAAAQAETIRDARTTPRRSRRRASPRTAAAACVVSSTALAFAVLGWPLRDGASDSSVAAGVAAASPTPTRTPASVATTARAAGAVLARRLHIPLDYLALYRRAAARYGLDWTRLAAVGAIESTHGQARAAGVATGANWRGARGPAQFLPGTWERFGVDGDANGSRDAHAPADAIAAMASYLRASGAPQDWRAALHSYNHSDAYVDAVERLAARYRQSMRRRAAR